MLYDGVSTSDALGVCIADYSFDELIVGLVVFGCLEIITFLTLRIFGRLKNSILSKSGAFGDLF
jgi:hypothetical protein